MIMGQIKMFVWRKSNIHLFLFVFLKPGICCQCSSETQRGMVQREPDKMPYSALSLYFSFLVFIKKKKKSGWVPLICWCVFCNINRCGFVCMCVCVGAGLWGIFLLVQLLGQVMQPVIFINGAFFPSSKTDVNESGEAFSMLTRAHHVASSCLPSEHAHWVSLGQPLQHQQRNSYCNYNITPHIPSVLFCFCTNTEFCI